MTADGKKFGKAYQGCCTTSKDARQCNAYNSQYTNQWCVSVVCLCLCVCLFVAVV